jgi:citrate synthase
LRGLGAGLLTIGPRFGGAIDDAARYFKDACDRVSEAYLNLCGLLIQVVHTNKRFE